MWKCKHCAQSFNFLRATEKANHSRHCLQNPKRLETYKNVKINQRKFFNEKLGEYKNFAVVCSCCEKEFSVREREFQHPKKEQYFCSRNCANSEGGKARSKKHHSDDVAHYCTVAWRHHEKRCVVCGEAKIVAVHHYNEVHSDNDPKNLIPLCPTHHQYMHSRYKQEIIGIVDNYIKNRWGQGVVGGMQDLHS